MAAKKPPRLWNPSAMWLSEWTPLGKQRVCRNMGCSTHVTNREVCTCGVETEPLGGDVCSRNGNGTASNGKRTTGEKGR